MTTGRRALFALLLIGAGSSACGRLEGAGTIQGARLPEQVVAERSAAQAEAGSRLANAARAPAPDKQVLFGDLHVHTTFSADAFAWSLPILQGEGAHPVADACDFARYCSGLDFWSITDHAESITPARWRETRESIRQCNALAGDAGNPDLVSFLGWEWTQIGATPKDHYGHKNVLFLDTEDERVPRRPIDSDSFATRAMRQQLPLLWRVGIPLLDFRNRQRYFDIGAFMADLRGTPRCPAGVDVHELPDDCMEGAATPVALFEKLDQWGFESLVIPHGTTWGVYTPAGSRWDKQLVGAQHDPERQRLIEVFSGHGNSEEYRSWHEALFDAQGEASCPAPTPGYEACCWRAGEIIRNRCDDQASGACEQRVAEARRDYLAADVAGRNTVPGTEVADWLDCGQCRDCFLPSMNYRPRSSVQYIAALSNFEQPGEPRRFQFGFIASSDNHSARPGTGYKEYGRLWNTEARGPRDEDWRERAVPAAGEEPTPEPVRFDPETTRLLDFQVLDFERQASFFLTGGLAAVHAEGRDRKAIWEALRRREVYGTSGERMLLWFELLNAPAGPVAMGGEARLAAGPRFRVRAVGSLRQQPGCPDVSVAGLAPERLEQLCHGECYYPGDERHPIDRIEVVRIRPQALPGEPVDGLIEDAWRVFPCAPDPEGCVVEFEDPEFVGSSRPHTYYVRAIQPPTPTVSAEPLRCVEDAEGRCVEARPCYGDYRTDASDDCLAPSEERAWSSPIYVLPVY